MINLKSTVAQEVAFLRGFKEKQVPFAVANAINKIAFNAKNQWQKQLPKKIDRPTTFTRSGWRVDKASKQHLGATIYAMDKQEGYLKSLETGEEVRSKRKSLLIPAKGVSLTAYGGVRRVLIKNNLGKSLFFGKVAGKGKRKSQGISGVWQKKGKGERPVLLATFAKRFRTKKRLGFAEFMQLRTGNKKVFSYVLDKELQRAWASAKV